MQDLQVMAHRGLGEADGLREVAAARLGAGAGGDQAQQAEPGRVGERLEGGREDLGAILGQRSGEERRAARVDLGDELHLYILTDVDTSSNISTAIDTVAREGGR